MDLIVRILRLVLRSLRDLARGIASELRQTRAARNLRGFDKVQLGAGPNALPGWANIDLVGENIHWDLTRPLPVTPLSIRIAYTEHFIEHVTRSEAVAILKNVRVSLKTGGVVRISTPDLRVLASAYLENRVIQMPHGDWFPRTPCEMLNESMHNWGHQFLYDEPELRSVLTEAGFTDVRRVRWGKSSHAELCGLETRPDFGDLIVEAMV
jgi:predicted SAM-dependent methyltransferase